MTDSEPKYPRIRVRLVGEDGNAFGILAKVMKALKKEGCSPEEIQKYKTEATSGDYDHLLSVTMRWVDCD
jgi:hypothetical protein